MLQQKFKTQKSQQTLEKVLSVADALFREQGIHNTTMRDISKMSNLGLGALYYYFDSKEDLILHFYQQTSKAVFEEYASQPKLPKNLPDAFSCFMTIKLKHLAGHRELLKVVIREAVDPDSSLSPFSRESSDVLRGNLQFIETLLEPSAGKTRIDRSLMAKALWMLHMLVLVYWLHDKSKDAEATGKLLETLKGCIGVAEHLEKLPGSRHLAQKLLEQLSTPFREVAHEPLT